MSSYTPPSKSNRNGFGKLLCSYLFKGVGMVESCFQHVYFHVRVCYLKMAAG